ncbi:DMT family transporter [Paenibacillus sp. EC2-1]|uniref:DMT family transporter n=1 Tax=Paenibacillus sp. EC2-1 TaxID=3388665 RepID=UPI003BEEF61D
MKPLKADLLIFFVTICWGSSYLFMKMGLGTLGEFNLVALRFGLAFIVAAALFHRRLRHLNRKTFYYAMLLGLLLFLVFTAITFGLKTTSTSNAGFLVSLTVVFVPLISSFIYKKKIENKIFISILLALVGIAFLTIKLPFTFAIGDFLCMAAACFYAIHILVVGSAAQKVDTLNLGILQLGFAGVYGLIFSIIFETPVFPSTTDGWVAILALSLVCSALGFIIQVVAQKYTSPTKTGLIFSMEPVFAAMFGYWFADEIMDSNALIGAALVLLSIVVATVNVNISRRSRVKTTPTS